MFNFLEKKIFPKVPEQSKLSRNMLS